MTDESNNASAAFDAVAEAKRLLRSARAAALATLAKPADDPFSSLVNVATTADGSPILLLSRLAAHTRHLDSDSRASLMFYSALNAPSGGDPLTHPRLTIQGRAIRVKDADEREILRGRFLARHPKSRLYADFSDFGFFRVNIEAAHINGGFGRAANLAAHSISTSLIGAEALVAEEAKLIAEIESEEPRIADELAYAHGATADEKEWRLLGFDPEGLDLGDGETILRIGFEKPVSTPAELRRSTAALLASGRHTTI